MISPVASFSDPPFRSLLAAALVVPLEREPFLVVATDSVWQFLDQELPHAIGCHDQERISFQWHHRLHHVGRGDDATT